MSPAPVETMVHEAAAARRRRFRVVTLAAAAVVAGVVGTTFALTGGGGSSPAPGPADRTSDRTADLTGMRLVGVGNVVVGVPASWPEGELHCGTPMADTFSVGNGGVTPACLAPRPDGVEEVAIGEGAPYEFEVAETYEIDGVEAQRGTTTCGPNEVGLGGPPKPGSTPTPGDPEGLCTSTVYLPSEDVSVDASSSTSRATLEELLSRISVRRDTVGVPGYLGLDNEQQGRAGAAYVKALEEAGLVAEVREVKQAGTPPGWVDDVSPTPGTVVAPGSTVVVTTIAEPETPAEMVAVGLTAMDDDMNTVDRTDEQIRRGTTIRVKVGEWVWVYGDGKHSRTLAGQLDGDALELDTSDGPNQGHSWVVARPGTTTITVTVTADGKTWTIGTIEVVATA